MKEAYKQLSENLVRNLAYNFFQLDFHMKATDEELELFYGAKVNKEELIKDTENKINGDQRLLDFYLNKFHEEEYQDPFRNFDRSLRGSTLQTSGSANLS